MVPRVMTVLPAGRGSDFRSGTGANEHEQTSSGEGEDGVRGCFRAAACRPTGTIASTGAATGFPGRFARGPATYAWPDGG